jgi:hypothetical protein
VSLIEAAFQMRDALKKFTNPADDGCNLIVSDADVDAAQKALTEFERSIQVFTEQAEAVALRNELAKYVRGINNIYNHNEAAKAAVVQAFGVNHSPLAMRADLTAPKDQA